MKALTKIAAVGLVALLATAGGASAQVNLQNYVALGDSLTAGYASAGLAEFYQAHSYPAILARQFGMASFAQPTVSDPGIPAVLELTALNITSQGVSPVIVEKDGQGAPTNAQYAGIYNNLGIPGANTNDLLTKTGNIMNLATGQSTASTVFYDLVLRDGVNPAINQAIGAKGTFYTVWIGNNDVLGAVLSGVAVDGVTLTPVAAFTEEYQTLLGALHAGAPAARIMVGNIPDVLAIPFITTVKPYLVNPANGSHIPLIGTNGPLTENDYVTLGAAELIAKGIGIPAAAGGTGIPLPEGSIDAEGLHAGVVLRADEVALIRQRTTELNAVIAQTASAMGAVLFDVNALFNDIAAHGKIVGGVDLTAAFLTGGLFSYDGVHPQRLGYAVVANEMIKRMNQAFGSAVPEVNLNAYLNGTVAATSTGAAKTVFTLSAYRSLLKVMAPQVLTDTLEVRRPLRRNVELTREPVVRPMAIRH